MTRYRKLEVLLFKTFWWRCITVQQNILASKLRYIASADTMDFQPFVRQVISCLTNDFVYVIVLKQTVSDCRFRVPLPSKQQLAAAAVAAVAAAAAVGAAALIRSRCCRRCCFCCFHSLSFSFPGYKTFCVAVYIHVRLSWYFSLFVASLTDYKPRFWHIRLRSFPINYCSII